MLWHEPTSFRHHLSLHQWITFLLLAIHLAHCCPGSGPASDSCQKVEQFALNSSLEKSLLRNTSTHQSSSKTRWHINPEYVEKHGEKKGDLFFHSAQLAEVKRISLLSRPGLPWAARKVEFPARPRLGEVKSGQGGRRKKQKKLRN